ncbi:hypothetical protein ACFWAN_20785 [Streptomyces mirabilis]|uniref:hypothetical protein n=1 Tax=Streptomyces mirabilis TaxID=68239 RepID=UPI0036477ADA
MRIDDAGCMAGIGLSQVLGEGAVKTAGKATGGIVGTVPPLSPAEGAAGLSLPAAVFHGSQPRIMREIAVDITLMCDGVYSLEEVVHGGVPLLDAFGRPART